MPDLTAEYEDDFDPEIKRALSASSSLLRSFALHTLALHSDLMHRRKILALTALGVSKHEAEGGKNVLDSWDRAKLKTWAEEKKERIILAGSLKQKAPEGSRRRKGGGRGNNRNRYRNREDDSSPQQSRGDNSGGEKAEQSAEKSSKDGSKKSTSTPRKKPFQRGKDK